MSGTEAEKGLRGRPKSAAPGKGRKAQLRILLRVLLVLFAAGVVVLSGLLPSSYARLEDRKLLLRTDEFTMEEIALRNGNSAFLERLGAQQSERIDYLAQISGGKRYAGEAEAFARLEEQLLLLVECGLPFEQWMIYEKTEIACVMTLAGEDETSTLIEWQFTFSWAYGSISFVMDDESGRILGWSVTSSGEDVHMAKQLGFTAEGIADAMAAYFGLNQGERETLPFYAGGDGLITAVRYFRDDDEVTVPILVSRDEAFFNMPGLLGEAESLAQAYGEEGYPAEDYGEVPYADDSAKKDAAD